MQPAYNSKLELWVSTLQVHNAFFQRNNEIQSLTDICKTLFLQLELKKKIKISGIFESEKCWSSVIVIINQLIQ